MALKQKPTSSPKKLSHRRHTNKAHKRPTTKTRKAQPIVRKGSQATIMTFKNAAITTVIGTAILASMFIRTGINTARSLISSFK